MLSYWSAHFEYTDPCNNLKDKFNSCKPRTQFSQSPKHVRNVDRSREINLPKKSSQLTDPSESTALAVVVSASASLPISSHQIVRFCQRTVTESTMDGFSRCHWSMEFCTITKSSLPILPLNIDSSNARHMSRVRATNLFGASEISQKINRSARKGKKYTDRLFQTS